MKLFRHALLAAAETAALAAFVLFMLASSADAAKWPPDEWPPTQQSMAQRLPPPRPPETAPAPPPPVTAPAPQERPPLAQEQPREPTTVIQNVLPDSVEPSFLSGVLGDVLKVALAAAGLTLPPGVAMALMWLLPLLGEVIKNKRRGRMQDMVNTAAIAGTAELPRLPDGSIPADYKRQVVDWIVNYVKRQGAGTIKGLGMKPDSADAEEAIVARAERAFADISVPVRFALDKVTHSGASGAGALGELAGKIERLEGLFDKYFPKQAAQ